MIIYILIFLLQHYRFLINTNILQKQYYDLNRFFLYIKQNTKKLIFKVLIFILSFSLSFISKYFSYLFILFYLDKFESKIIKFKFSNRVKRNLVIFELINISCVFLSFYFKSSALLVFLSLICFYLSYFTSLIIEKIIQKINIKRAKKKLKAIDPKIIAITGSYGKTSCKNYINELLKPSYTPLISPMSYNTLNGLLITINKYLKPYHDVLIIEIGIDSKNGINKFLKNFNFDICVVTCIGSQHLKTFKSIENIAKEKTKLLYNAKEFAIINKDDPFIKDIYVTAKNITFSNNNDSDIKVSIEKENIDSTLLNIKIFNQTYLTSTFLIGKHNFTNIACSIATCKALNVSNDILIKNIAKLKNVEHRLSIKKDNKWTILDDSYNSNIEGFNNALDILNKSNDKKIIITPGIIENDKIDYEKLSKKISDVAHIIILINNPPLAKYIKNHLSFLTFKEAYDYLKANYLNEKLTILIENDLPDIFIR